MEFSNLAIEQESLRNINQIAEMVKFVKSGGFWTKRELQNYAPNSTEPMIQINKFSDGFLVLRNGHHRLVSTWLAGRFYLREDEYEVTHWPYSDPVNKTGYLDICHKNHWYTPFDPRTHVRASDIKYFKVLAKDMFAFEPENAVEWIESNSHLFRSPVTNIRTVSDLASSVNDRLSKNLDQN